MIRRLLLAAVFVALTAPVAAETTGYLTYDSAPESGYLPGFGVRLEGARSTGLLRPHATVRFTTERKQTADSGYTYSGEAGLRAVYNDLFVEAGGAAYGYRSQFGDGSVWQRHETNVYGRAGLDSQYLGLAATYYPAASSDPYHSTTIKAEMVVKGTHARVLFGIIQSSFRYTVAPYEHLTSTDMTVGLGWGW